MEDSRFSPLTVVLNTFFICIAVYFLEYRFFYKLGSIFDTAILTEIFVICAIFIALKLLNSNWKSIGYITKAKDIVWGIVKPIIILAICTAVTLLLIKLFVKSLGASLNIGINFNTPLPITLVSALISTVASETLLRGFVLQTINRKLKFYASNTINIALTIIWHLVFYVFDVILNGEDVATLLNSFIFICLIYGVSAVRKSLYTRTTGSIWECLSDCFLSLMIINRLQLTVNLPTDFSPTNATGKLIAFMSSKAINTTYASIILLSMINILALIIVITYCHILKKNALKKYRGILLEQQNKDM